MIGWLKNLSEQERRTVIEQAAARCGVPSQAMEKDWWVTLALKALYQTEYAPYLLFKGGTSLSKCYKLISRFSEDIDLAIDRHVLGYDDDLSRSQIKKLKREAAQFTSTKLLDALVLQLNNIGVPAGMIKVTPEEISDSQPDKDPQTLFLDYPSLFEPLEYLPSIVKIEVSALSLREPFADCEVETMLQEYFPNELYEERPFVVRSVEPQRTFLEKIFLLHEELLRPNAVEADRKSRHFYDIVMLMNTDYATAALQDLGLYEKIVQHRSLYYRLPKVDYEKHAHDTINFIPGLDLLNRFENDYRTMREQMIYNEAPAFPELIQRLRELRWKFRYIKPVHLPHGLSLNDVFNDAAQKVSTSLQSDFITEGAFISTPVYYNMDIMQPPSPANENLAYLVSFTVYKGKLLPDDIQAISFPGSF